MSYEILYHPDVKKIDLPLIDQPNRDRIKRAIEQRLVSQPEVYAKPLRKTLRGYWRLRVGDYRIVFVIKENQITILGIIHRRLIYKDIESRIG